MYNLLRKKGLLKKFVWKDLGEEVIGIKCIGNYNAFIDSNYLEGTFVINKRGVIKIQTHKEFFKDLLNEGKSIFYKNYIMFKVGNHTEYMEYVFNYIQEFNNFDEIILSEIKDKTSFGRVKAYINMFKNGTLNKSTLIKLISKNLINEERIDIILNNI
ncbi:MAG: hypothetical protein GX889_11970 [Clostridiales bacterium]|nr:hypothetical protein [Clostridiales bacterium]